MQDTRPMDPVPPASTQESAYSRQHLDQIIAELTANGSIEISTDGDEIIPLAAQLLPYGMAIYIPKSRRHPLQDSLARIALLHEAGFDPVPHIAARQVSSVGELRGFLDRVVHESKVHRVLVIGGDTEQVSGPFPDSASLIKSGVLVEAGIREVDVAGYPEGHPRIPLEILQADLDSKLASTREQGLGMNIITQFSFIPSRIVEYCDELAHRAPLVPVYIGLAGPTDFPSLLRFARHCGVSESLRALMAMGVKAARLACHTKPDEQIEFIARYCAGHEVSNVIGTHIFSFGGFEKSAKWVRDKIH